MLLKYPHSTKIIFITNEIPTDYGGKIYTIRTLDKSSKVFKPERSEGGQRL